jgi:hypothetical protein
MPSHHSRRLVHWHRKAAHFRWNDKERLMTRAGARILDGGEMFPDLSIDTVKHGRLALPEGFGIGWGVFLIYRAHW